VAILPSAVRSNTPIDAEPESRSWMGEVCWLSLLLNIPLLTVTISFGPDPYLNGEGAFETITGIQSVGVQACAKHLLANNQEHWRYGLSANLDDRTMREIYFYPFLRSIEVRLVCLSHRILLHWMNVCPPRPT
jgi:hypothetical protein